MHYFVTISTVMPLPDNVVAKVNDSIRGAVRDFTLGNSESIIRNDSESGLATVTLVSAREGEILASSQDGMHLFGTIDNGTLTELGSHVKWRNGSPLVSSKTPGTFCCAFVNRHDSNITAFSSRPASTPIFYANSENMAIVGSDALLVACALSVLNEREIELESGYVEEYLAWGYPYSSLTPFSGVVALGSGKVLQGNAVFGLGVEDLRNSDFDDFTDANEQEKAFAVSNSLLNSVLRHKDSQQLLLRLSGGKDSRILISAMFAAGADVVTETRGHES